MTERDINGDAVRGKFRQARKTAAELGLTPEVMETLAEGVREFDAERNPVTRQTKALEKIALHLTPPRTSGDNWPWEEQRLRRREVQALELLAVLPVATDEEVARIQEGSIYKRIIERLALGDAAPA